MEQYVGRKMVNAVPMNQEDFYTLMEKGPALKQEGYLVEYLDDGEANTSSYKGCISWSSKEVFEKSYKVSTTYIDRLNIEIEELSEKITKLSNYIHNVENGNTESTNDYDLIKEQMSIMKSYAKVLNERLK